MMTRPIAVARSVIVTGVVWALGAALVVGIYSAFGSSSTIDLGGDQRATVLWLGAHAFFSCAGALGGTILGASALIRAGIDGPSRAVALVGGTTLAFALLAAVIIGGMWDPGPATELAMVVGLVIGVGAGAFYVVHSGEEETTLPYLRSPQRGTAHRGWNSR